MNITAKRESDGLHFRVIGISNAAINPDVYDFIYSDGTLTRTSYLLEALQPHDRDAAKTLLSVTWTVISVLVDPDEWKWYRYGMKASNRRTDGR